MAVSIRDVAKKTSLSCETILEGLISPSSLEPELVRFIMKSIQETGYLETFTRWKRPTASGSIAVLVAQLESPDYIEIFKGIDRALSSLGLTSTMIAFPTRFSPVVRESTLNRLLSVEQVEAVIVINMKCSQDIVNTFLAAKKPLILIETQVIGAHSVLLENQRGMSIGINYLFGKGYRRIALVNGPTSNPDSGSVNSERLIGYLTALQRKGLPLDESLVYETRNCDVESGAQAFRHFKNMPLFPDAIFSAAGDMVAIGFMTEARTQGMKIPQDIAILGYDDLPVARFVTPPLSTIRQRLMIAGAAALVLALETIMNGTVENIIIVPELIERGSV